MVNEARWLRMNLHKNYSWMKSNHVWYAARVLRDLYNFFNFSFIAVVWTAAINSLFYCSFIAYVRMMLYNKTVLFYCLNTDLLLRLCSLWCGQLSSKKRYRYEWSNSNLSGEDLVSAGLTIIREAHTNVRRGPFSRMRSQDFLICGGALFSPKKLTTFLVVVTFKRTLTTLNV